MGDHRRGSARGCHSQPADGWGNGYHSLSGKIGIMEKKMEAIMGLDKV